ncbi:hypothetical protein SLA2020_281400 [Shorea laevis]
MPHNLTHHRTTHCTNCHKKPHVHSSIAHTATGNNVMAAIPRAVAVALLAQQQHYMSGLCAGVLQLERCPCTAIVAAVQHEQLSAWIEPHMHLAACTVALQNHCTAKPRAAVLAQKRHANCVSFVCCPVASLRNGGVVDLCCSTVELEHIYVAAQ